MLKASRSIPAKLRPPRLQRVLMRERLFARLDEQRDGAAVWIAGAPGAGKTMLAASYVQSRALRGLWYRLDADDNDIGHLFETLARAPALRAAAGRRPLFAAEHLRQPRSFARAWFRWAFDALPRPGVLVFDNLEQAPLPALPELLAAAIDELPEGLMLIVTSRHAPPAVLAAAQVSGALKTLAGAELDFRPEEARSYAREMQLDEARVLRAADRVKGWAAGLRLMSHAPVEARHDETAPALLFDYFAELLHDTLAPPVQQLLWIGALLPLMPADLLAELAALPTAKAELDRLCEHNLFIEPVAQHAGEYRLHPLWREFLLQRAGAALGSETCARLRAAAARAFDARGDTDAAIDLWLDAGDAKAARDRLCAVLESKLALGQLAQWAHWVARLPVAMRESDPELQYGLARIAFLQEDASALAHYQRAGEGFAAQGRLRHQQLCAAGVLEWSYNSDSFIGHRRWCELLRRDTVDETTDDEITRARLLNGRVLAAFFSGDFECQGDALTESVLALLSSESAENDRLSLGISLLGCLERHKRWPEAQQLAARMQALLAAPRLGSRVKILVRQQIAIDLHRQTGEYGELARLAQCARQEAHEHGFPVLEYEAVAGLLYAALYTGDETQAQRLLAELRAMSDPASVYHRRFMHQGQAWLALQFGQPARALVEAQGLREAIGRSEMPPAFAATWLLVAVLARFAHGDEMGALTELQTLQADVEPAARALLQAQRLALEAWRWRRDGDDAQADEALRAAFALAAPLRYFQLLGPLRSHLSELAAQAIERGIEPEFTQALIARRCLRPTGTALLSARWPWALRVETLGHFALQVDGRPLVFDGKVPRKPLALLKALVALGPAPVPESTLVDALWRGEEADAAHAALNVALHRLRKLVGPSTTTLHDGAVSLDASRVWVDARAFERAVIDGDLPRALALYRGDFLAADVDEPWAVTARERLRARFSRAVVAHGQTLAGQGRHEEAIAVYRRGLDNDDLDEAFTQGLMRCALGLHSPATGIAAYQRLKRTLALRLGVAPSAQTEALMRELRAS